jgi:hypothetical protein
MANDSWKQSPTLSMTETGSLANSFGAPQDRSDGDGKIHVCSIPGEVVTIASMLSQT